MRVALLGGGTIARLVLEQRPPGVDVVALAGRSPGSRGVALAREYAIPYLMDRGALIAKRPDVVV